MLKRAILAAALALGVVAAAPFRTWAQTVVGPGWLKETSPPAAPFPAVIAANGSWSSGVLPLLGYSGISASVTSNESGAISIQRYLDRAGSIKVGTAVSQAITAGTPATVSVNDGLPALYFQVTITNGSGSSSAATSGIAIILTGF
jgi:hypothetical protein